MTKPRFNLGDTVWFIHIGIKQGRLSYRNKFLMEIKCSDGLKYMFPVSKELYATEEEARNGNN